MEVSIQDEQYTIVSIIRLAKLLRFRSAASIEDSDWLLRIIANYCVYHRAPAWHYDGIEAHKDN